MAMLHVAYRLGPETNSLLGSVPDPFRRKELTVTDPNDLWAVTNRSWDTLVWHLGSATGGRAVCGRTIPAASFSRNPNVTMVDCPRCLAIAARGQAPARQRSRGGVSVTEPGPAWTFEEVFPRIALIIDQVETKTSMPVRQSQIAAELAEDPYVVEAAQMQTRSTQECASNMGAFWTKQWTLGTNPYMVQFTRLTVDGETAYCHSPPPMNGGLAG
jgi:hypothetical protein